MVPTVHKCARTNEISWKNCNDFFEINESLIIYGRPIIKCVHIYTDVIFIIPRTYLDFLTISKLACKIV